MVHLEAGNPWKRKYNNKKNQRQISLICWTLTSYLYGGKKQNSTNNKTESLFYLIPNPHIEINTFFRNFLKNNNLTCLRASAKDVGTLSNSPFPRLAFVGVQTNKGERHQCNGICALKLTLSQRVRGTPVSWVPVQLWTVQFTSHRKSIGYIRCFL